MDSILNSVKKVLGVHEDDHNFDVDIIMHINTVFGVLLSLGIGPLGGFEIEDDTATWDDFLQGETPLNPVKTFVSQKVRLVFDPPATSFALDAIKQTLTELEFRLNVHRENTVYGVPHDHLQVIDGGNP